MSKYNKVTPKNISEEKWFRDIIEQSQLAKISKVKGSFILEPYGLKIWELIRINFDIIFDNKKIKFLIDINNNLLKEKSPVFFFILNNEYIRFPIFLDKKDFEKEKKHLDGFSAEIYQINKKVILKPTGEIHFMNYFKTRVNSYRQLPLVLTQWGSAFRNELRTSLLYRNNQFYWKETHAFLPFSKTYTESFFKLLQETYTELISKILNISKEKLIIELRPEEDKFPGAEKTLAFDLLDNNKLLQVATIHKISKELVNSFDLSYIDESNENQRPNYITAGFSTRILIPIIKTFLGQENTSLPPCISPIFGIYYLELINSKILKNKFNEIEAKFLEFRNQYNEKNKYSSNILPNWLLETINILSNYYYFFLNDEGSNSWLNDELSKINKLYNWDSRILNKIEIKIVMPIFLKNTIFKFYQYVKYFIDNNNNTNIIKEKLTFDFSKYFETIFSKLNSLARIELNKDRNIGYYYWETVNKGIPVFKVIKKDFLNNSYPNIDTRKDHTK